MKLREWIKNQNFDYKECLYLIKGVFGFDNIDLDEEINFFPLFCLNKSMELRKQNIPLAKILQKKYFYKYLFHTNLDTLDPRPESENIINYVKGKPRSILDLGTGTGCLLLSLLKNFPKAFGTGIDISEKALEVALINKENLNVKKASFKIGNWGYEVSGHYDLIVCNPPYVDKKLNLTQETLHDPESALFGNEDVYHDIMKSLENVTFGQLIFEVPNYLLDKLQFSYNILGHENDIYFIEFDNVYKKDYL